MPSCVAPSTPARSRAARPTRTPDGSPIVVEPSGDSASAEVRGSGPQVYATTVEVRETRRRRHPHRHHVRLLRRVQLQARRRGHHRDPRLHRGAPTPSRRVAAAALPHDSWRRKAARPTEPTVAVHAGTLWWPARAPAAPTGRCSSSLAPVATTRARRCCPRGRCVAAPRASGSRPAPPGPTSRRPPAASTAATRRSTHWPSCRSRSGATTRTCAEPTARSTSAASPATPGGCSTHWCAPGSRCWARRCRGHDRAVADHGQRRLSPHRGRGAAGVGDPVRRGDRPTPSTDDRAMLIGHPAHGIAAWDADRPRQLWLAPFDEPLDQPLRTLVQNRSGIRVPATDTAEFLRDFYPRLQRAVGSVRVDPRLDVPEIVPPRLSMTIHHDGLTAAVDWGFVYEVDGQPVRTSWGPGGEPFRDPAAERALIGAFVGPARPAGHHRRHRARGADPTDPRRRVPRGGPERGRRPGAGRRRRRRPGHRRPSRLPARQRRPGRAHLAGGRQGSAQRLVRPGGHRHDRRREGRTSAPCSPRWPRGRAHVVLLSGTYLSLDRPELVRLRELIEEARGLTDRSAATGCGSTGSRPGGGTSWPPSASSTEQSSGGQTVRGRLDLAATRSRCPTCPPASTPAAALPAGGLRLAGFLHRHGLGGILADDMGLGKTVQALALIVPTRASAAAEPVPRRRPHQRRRATGRAEAARFAPGLTVAHHHRRPEPAAAPTLADAIAGADLVVTSYALFRIEFDAYAEHDVGAACCSTRPSSSRTTRARPTSAPAASTPPSSSRSPARRWRTR